MTHETSSPPLAGSVNGCKKRASPVSYRPPIDLAVEFEAMVRASGLSTNAFITDAVFNKRKLGAAETHQLTTTLAKLGQLADKYRSTAIGPEETDSDVEGIRGELVLLRTLIMRALGRRS